MHRRTIAQAAAALLSGWTLCAVGLRAQAAPPPATGQALRFEVAFDPALQTTPYTGRVYIVLSKHLQREPRQMLREWFDPPQVVARDVQVGNPDHAVILDATAITYPRKLSEIEPGEYHVQAIARRSLDHPVPGMGPGDLISEPRTLALHPRESGTIGLRLTRVVVDEPFDETERLKDVEVDSPLLSAFHKRPMKMRAGVVLPKEWEENAVIKYPVLYWIGGFGGTHRFAHQLARMTQRMDVQELADRVLQVVPDPTCYRGHAVFADSENNGPWGRALLEELIPYVEKKYRAAGAEHRYVTGVSSGGWSSLWLQINYPAAFNGCWAHVPDPVDFRDFQRIDLYAPDANIYTDASGQRRALARHDGQVVLYYQDFVKMEEVLGPGGQIHSFEAVFSPRRADGAPASIFDRTTGKVFSDVAKTWERYDIRLILERRWNELGPKLKGKLHVYAGEQDTFYLDGAVGLLKDSLVKLGSDAEVIIVPGMGHGLHREKIKPMCERIVENFGASRKDSKP